MARFYIHVENGAGFIRDDDGTDFSGLDAARFAAVHAGADIIADDLKLGCTTVNLTMFVEDADHCEIMRIPITASVST